jgi:hypothetical protein
MTFGATLDGLATRITVGSGRDAWETHHCEPWGRCSDALKAPVISLSLSSCVMLYFPQSTHSLL